MTNVDFKYTLLARQPGTPWKPVVGALTSTAIIKKRRLFRRKSDAFTKVLKIERGPDHNQKLDRAIAAENEGIAQWL